MYNVSEQSLHLDLAADFVLFGREKGSGVLKTAASAFSLRPDFWGLAGSIEFSEFSSGDPSKVNRFGKQVPKQEHENVDNLPSI